MSHEPVNDMANINPDDTTEPIESVQSSEVPQGNQDGASDGLHETASVGGKHVGKLSDFKPDNHESCHLQYLGCDYSLGVAFTAYFCIDHQIAFKAVNSSLAVR